MLANTPPYLLSLKTECQKRLAFHYGKGECQVIASLHPTILFSIDGMMQAKQFSKVKLQRVDIKC